MLLQRLDRVRVTAEGVSSVSTLSGIASVSVCPEVLSGHGGNAFALSIGEMSISFDRHREHCLGEI